MTAEKMTISFPLITEGRDTELDVLNIAVLALRQLDGEQIERVLKYLEARYTRRG